MWVCMGVHVCAHTCACVLGVILKMTFQMHTLRAGEVVPLAYSPQSFSSSHPPTLLGGRIGSLGGAGKDVPVRELVLMLAGPLPSCEPHPKGCYRTPIFSKSEKGTAGLGG